MKTLRQLTICAVALVSLLFAASCVKEELNPESIIKVKTTEMNDFDKWLEVNFRNPYNIDFKYRYEINESDMNYFTIPARYDLAIVMAHLVKHLCVETYDEVAGVTFTRTYFPKMFFLTGEWEYRNNGTIILGTAEGGKKILLAGINLLPRYMKTTEDLNHYYIKTIHHEFTHIINQTKDYPTDFKMVTGTGYVADSWSTAPYDQEYLQNGFISAYSQYSDGEDFAEMVSEYVTHDEEWWNKQLRDAGESGAAALVTKLGIVRNYMHDSFNIDIEQLRATVIRRQNEVFSGKVDLNDITIK